MHGVGQVGSASAVRWRHGAWSGLRIGPITSSSSGTPIRTSRPSWTEVLSRIAGDEEGSAARSRRRTAPSRPSSCRCGRGRWCRSRSPQPVLTFGQRTAEAHRLTKIELHDPVGRGQPVGHREPVAHDSGGRLEEPDREHRRPTGPAVPGPSPRRPDRSRDPARGERGLAGHPDDAEHHPAHKVRGSAAGRRAARGTVRDCDDRPCRGPRRVVDALGRDYVCASV